MTRKLKIYSHADSCNSFLPPDVITALGERSHVRQGTVYVWATTAKAATVRLDALGLHVNSPRDLRVADHGTARTLDEAFPWPESTVLAVRLSGGGPVVEIVSAQAATDRLYDIKRTLRTVGDLSNRLRFTPADVLEPVVTEAMVDAALDALGATMPDGAFPGWMIRNMPAAIAAALKAQVAQQAVTG